MLGCPNNAGPDQRAARRRLRADGRAARRTRRRMARRRLARGPSRRARDRRLRPRRPRPSAARRGVAARALRLAGRVADRRGADGRVGARPLAQNVLLWFRDGGVWGIALRGGASRARTRGPATTSSPRCSARSWPRSPRTGCGRRGRSGAPPATASARPSCGRARPTRTPSARTGWGRRCSPRRRRCTCRCGPGAWTARRSTCARAAASITGCPAPRCAWAARCATRRACARPPSRRPTR